MPGLILAKKLHGLSQLRTKKNNPNKVEHFNMSIKCAFVPRKKVAHFQTHNTQHYSDHEFQLKL